MRAPRRPDWTLFAAYAATATTPNTGGMARARWAHLLKGDPDALHTANSFEQATDELCFMLGPVLAAVLCGTLFPEAGTLVGAVLLLTGMLLFTAQRATEPPARPRPRGRAPLRAPGMPPLLVVCLALGGVFGAMEVVTIAFADAQGHRTAAGVVLALQAAGSCAAGLLYGAWRPAGPAESRLPWCVAAMAALLTLPVLAAPTGSLTLLAGTLLLGGMATAPAMVTTMTLVQRRTPEGRLNEGMTLAVTGLLGGIACGSAAGAGRWSTSRPRPGTGCRPRRPRWRCCSRSCRPRGGDREHVEGPVAAATGPSTHGDCGDGGNRTRVQRCGTRASPCAVRCAFLGPGDHADKSPTGSVTVWFSSTPRDRV